MKIGLDKKGPIFVHKDELFRIIFRSKTMFRIHLFISVFLLQWSFYSSAKTLQVGDQLQMPSHELRYLANGHLQSKEYIVLDFWATWCGPCVTALPKMNQTALKYADKAQFLAIGDEPEEKVTGFLKDKNFQHITFAIDTKKTLFSAFDIQFRPVTVLLNKSGEILWIGRSEGIELALTKVTSGKPIDMPVSETFAKYYKYGATKKQMLDHSQGSCSEGKHEE